jgi:DNA-binding transcriptional ArsR family regulator
MPYRTLVTKELADLFRILSHPIRIRIVEELSGQERDVNSLASILQLSSSGVSQHLSLMRTHKLIIERKQGRNVYYHLRQPEIATWLLGGLAFIGPDKAEVHEFQSAIKKARRAWLPNLGEG